MIGKPGELRCPRGPTLGSCVIALLAAACVAGCSTPLDPGSERIRLVTAEQKRGCESLGLISTDQQLGPHKASNAMNMAINEVARRGGNAVFLVSQVPSGLDGVSVTAEALRCSVQPGS